MRKRGKEVGLGFLTLLIVVLAVVGLQQPIVRKYVPANFGPWLVLATVLVMYLGSVRWLERRPISEFSLHGAWREMLAGLFTGFALFASVMGILWCFGVYHPAGLGNGKALGAGLALAMMAGVFEEILFRGILFRISARIVGTWGALLFTASIFGAAHLANKGATLFSGVAIMLEAGILLGAAYALTGRLWLPIGLHIAWNFTEGSIFGVSVSGTAADSALVRGSLSGPPLLTGGAFGPEASVVAVLVCLMVAIYFLYRTVKLGRIEPPAWIRPRSVAPTASQIA